MNQTPGAVLAAGTSPLQGILTGILTNTARQKLQGNKRCRLWIQASQPALLIAPLVQCSAALLCAQIATDHPF
jgi:hypothetical protein